MGEKLTGAEAVVTNAPPHRSEDAGETGRLKWLRILPLPISVLILAMVVSPQWMLLLSSTGQFEELSQGAPLGDFALTELCTWHALEGSQLTGHYSRFGFRNLGPAYYYVMAPLYGAAGCNYLALQWSTLVIAAIAAAGTIVVVGKCAGYMGFVFSAILLSLYVKFLGPQVFATTWQAYVVVLPMLLATVLFAAVGSGRAGCLPFSIVVSSFAMQIHLACVPVLVVLGVMSVGLLVIARSRASATAETPARQKMGIPVIASVVLLLVLWFPPIFQELTSRVGNLSRLVSFFLEQGRCHGWHEAVEVLELQLSDFPMWCLGQGSVTGETLGERNVTATMAAKLITYGQITAVVACGILSWKRGGRFVWRLCVLCIAGTLIGAVSITRIVGAIEGYTVFWMSSLSVVGILAITLTIAELLPARITANRQRAIWMGFAAGGLALILAVAEPCNRDDDVEDIMLQGKGPEIAARLAHSAEQATAECPGRPVSLSVSEIELMPYAACVCLRLTKNGHPVAINHDWYWIFGHQHARTVRGTNEAAVHLCLVGPSDRPDWQMRPAERCSSPRILRLKP